MHRLRGSRRVHRVPRLLGRTERAGVLRVRVRLSFAWPVPDRMREPLQAHPAGRLRPERRLQQSVPEPCTHGVTVCCGRVRALAVLAARGRAPGDLHAGRAPAHHVAGPVQRRAGGHGRGLLRPRRGLRCLWRRSIRRRSRRGHRCSPGRALKLDREVDGGSGSGRRPRHLASVRDHASYRRQACTVTTSVRRCSRARCSQR